MLALTDHDELAGLAEARDAARDAGIAFVPGSELSVTWRDTTLHVLGLGVNPDDDALAAGLDDVRLGRDARARRIGDALGKAGIPEAFEGALAYVTRARLVSRTHFARFLIKAGHARDMKDVFRRYLSKGNPGYVAHAWPTLGEAVTWIHGAGGQAVIAHPGRYKIDRSARRELFGEFRDLGGDAIEVISPSHDAAQYREFANLARTHGLRGSCGTDFHGEGESHVDFGDLPPLPPGVEPVWRDW